MRRDRTSYDFACRVFLTEITELKFESEDAALNPVGFRQLLLRITTEPPGFRNPFKLIQDQSFFHISSE